MSNDNPWVEEPAPVSEAEFTPWGDGWMAWNERSPEVEFVEFIGALVKMIRPERVIETGVGQGFTTRRVQANLIPEGVINCYESDDGLRSAIPDDDDFVVWPEQSPVPFTMSRADLVILDSFWSLRLEELELFADTAKAGAVVVVHDVAGRGAGPVQEMFKKQVDQLREDGKISGAFLPNPRGCFIGTRI